jgi:hypothetical protein
MLKEKIAGIIENIRLIDGVKLCALISRDGIMLGRYSAGDFNEAWFAAMCATLLASADGILIIMGAGEKILLAALVDPSWDLIQMTGMLREVAEDVGGAF